MSFDHGGGFEAEQHLPRATEPVFSRMASMTGTNPNARDFVPSSSSRQSPAPPPLLAPSGLGSFDSTMYATNPMDDFGQAYGVAGIAGGAAAGMMSGGSGVGGGAAGLAGHPPYSSRSSARTLDLSFNSFPQQLDPHNASYDSVFGSNAAVYSPPPRPMYERGGGSSSYERRVIDSSRSSPSALPVHTLPHAQYAHLQAQIPGYRGTRSQTNSPSPLRTDVHEPDQRRFTRRLSLVQGPAGMRDGLSGNPAHDVHRLAAESFSHPSSPAMARGPMAGVHSPAARPTPPRSSLATGAGPGSGTSSLNASFNATSPYAYGSPMVSKQLSAPTSLTVPPAPSSKTVSPRSLSPRSFSPIDASTAGLGVGMGVGMGMGMGMPMGAAGLGQHPSGNNLGPGGFWPNTAGAGPGPGPGSSPGMGAGMGVASTKQPWPKNLDDELKSLGTFEAAKERFEWILQHCSPAEASEKERNEVYAKGFMALGGVGKQHGRIAEARQCYSRARSMAKTFPTAWSSAAKFEEELGLHQRSLALVEEGLEYCRNSYLLIRKRVELVELLSGPSGARRVLARLPPVLQERDWKCWSHGALLEARYGRPRVAQAIYASLRAVVRPKSQHFGKLCEDIVRFQERQGLYLNALCTARVVYDLTGQQNGLWFSLLRLQERLGAPIEDQVNAVLNALNRVSHDVTWKLWFLLAQFQDRVHDAVSARTSLAQAVATCSIKDHWKIWAGAARIELANGRPATAELLLLYALKHGPDQRRLSVLLDLARLAEHENNLEMARGLLELAPVFDRRDCRVPMERMLLESRAGRMAHAIAVGFTSLDDVVPSGRFWGILIHLTAALGPATQRRVISVGLQSVPKSGEIWCELGRWALNLHNRVFSVPFARQVLDVALHFTPQYGDSFIEYVRVELLSRGYTQALSDVRRHCIHAAPNYGLLWNFCRLHAAFDARLIFDTAFVRVCAELHANRSLYAKRLVAHIRVRPGLSPESIVEGRPMAQLCARHSERCRLCHTVLSHKHVVVLACGHFFHEACAKRAALPQVAVGPASLAKCCPLCSEPWCVVEYYLSIFEPERRAGFQGRSMPGSPAPAMLAFGSGPASSHGSGVYQFGHSISSPGTLPPQFGTSQLPTSTSLGAVASHTAGALYGGPASPALYPGTPPGCPSPVPNQFGSPMMARHTLGNVSPKRSGSPAMAAGASTSPAPSILALSPEEHAWMTTPLPPDVPIGAPLQPSVSVSASATPSLTPFSSSPSPAPTTATSQFANTLGAAAPRGAAAALSVGTNGTENASASTKAAEELDLGEDLCALGDALLGLVPPTFLHSCAIMEVHAVGSGPQTEITRQARRQLLFGPEYDVLSKL